MLNFEALQRQIVDFSAHHARRLVEREVRLERAIEIFEAAGKVDTNVFTDLVRGLSERLVADPLESLSTVRDVPDRPTPMTVVATDGSQIYPDRSLEPTCYLLNVSRIAFQYGTHEQPMMEAVPRLFFRGQDIAMLEGVDAEAAGREVVSALRDALELSELLEIAREARIEGRPILAIADGTMIRWMLRGMRNRKLERKLLDRYIEGLQAFRELGIPLCSYISMPATRDLTNLLSLWAKAEWEGEVSLDEMTDRTLIDRVLRAGQRSSVFRSRSLVLKEYPTEHQICSFYVKAAAPSGMMEIGRVEFPYWMTQAPDLVDLVHAVIYSETAKGQGYPMILSEAHEHAVVRGAERSLFYEMIERQMTQEGATIEGSMKQAAKERRG